MSDQNSNTPDVTAIQPIVLGSGLTGKFTQLKANFEAQAEERNLTAAANAMFSLRSPISFERLALTFDALEPASKVKKLEADLRAAQKANVKLNEANGRLSNNLGVTGKRASRVSQLEKELADQKAGFEGILDLLGVEPGQLEAMVAQMEAEASQESAIIVDAARKNRKNRGSILNIQKIAGSLG